MKKEIILGAIIALIFFSIASVYSDAQVGVKTGDWIKFDYAITGWPAEQPYPEWLRVEFLSVEGTTATVLVTMRMSDGTEQNSTVLVDVVTGGQALGLSGFVIPANLTTGDTIYMSGYGNVTITGETTRTYAGASRTVVYASFSKYGTQLTYYWDKQTGVLVEASATSAGMTMTAEATATNMWPAVFNIENGYTFSVTMASNSSISGFAFNESLKQISFNVTGPTGKAGYCNITIPNGLLWGEFSIYKDGSLLVKDADYTKMHNGTHYVFYITYIHSTHTIEIVSTEAIPEFPSFLILPLFMITTLIAAMIYRRKHSV